MGIYIHQQLNLGLWIISALFPRVCHSTQQVVGPAIRLEDCWNSMKQADADMSWTLNISEYFNLTKTLDRARDNVYRGIDHEDDAPDYWHLTWGLLESVCVESPTLYNCSEAPNPGSLYISQTRPRVDITKEPELYIFQVCWWTYAALRHSQDSPAPSAEPSYFPSTQAPSTSPSVASSATPSVRGSTAPSETPTLSHAPSASPTISHKPSGTSIPTVLPTEPPSTSPSISVSPTSSPSLHPSPIPSTSPSSPPSYFPVTRSVEQMVKLAFMNARAVPGGERDNSIMTEYYSLILISQQELFDGSVPDFTLRRRLRVLSNQNSCITQPVGEFVCPTNTVPTATTICENVRFVCSMTITGTNVLQADDIAALAGEVMSVKNQNSYQAILDKFLEESGLKAGDITVLKSASASAAKDSGGDPTVFSRGVTGGVVSVAILAVMIPFVLLLFYRNRPREGEKEKSCYEPYDVAEDAPSELEPDAMDGDLYAGAIAAQSLGVSVLGASRPTYGGMGMTKATQKYLEDVERGEDILAEPELDVERDSSSNAGSSGWSSSAGYSSYNTGSMDDSMDAAMAPGTTLAAVGIASSLSNNVRSGGSRTSHTTNSITSEGNMSASVGSVGGSPSVSREQLDSYIEAGDWAAVGATAALLAAASDSQSASSHSRSRRSRANSYESGSLEAARAAELDDLVDAGDWEGVVLAAARFEATEMTVSSKGSRTASSIDSLESQTHTDDGETRGSSKSQSESATGSDDPSRARQRKEIRAEVEALVRRVVPEEIDNVDEMMNQFKGREEELVETLRTMQERAIAQKARSAGHKTAKLEARKNVKRGYVPGARPPPPAASLRAAPTASVAPTPAAMPPRPPQSQARPTVVTAPPAAATRAAAGSKSSLSGSASIGGDSSTLGSLVETRSALEKAIDAGDWEAVGAAAAFISDASINTSEMGEIERTGQSNLSVTSNSTRTRNSKDSETAIRAAELDEMINRGDWNGVVAAAKRFSQLDKRAKSDTGRTPEEEEALAQAEFWTNIANQKKAEGANDVGASDAAEWAIQRSLSKMNKDATATTPTATEGEQDEV